MIIANLIYDVVFKRMMENEKIAKFFVGTLLEQTNFVDDTKIIKEFHHSTDLEEVKIITDILHHSGTNPEEKKKIENGKEALGTINAMFEDKEKRFLKELEENRKALTENRKALTEKNKALSSVIFALFMLSYLFSDAQDCTINNNPLVISSRNIKESYIEQTIRSNPKMFKKSDVDALLLNITTCNSKIENKIAQIKSRISDYYANKNDLTNLLDTIKMKERIEEKMKYKESIKEEIKNDLKNINFKGLYIVVIKDLKAFENMDSLARIASQIITPQAVLDLNGTFITGFTGVENDVTVRDYIEAEVSGEMTVDYKLIDYYSRADGIYVYLAKVGVSPLKKGVQSNESNSDIQKIAYKVFNVSNMNYESILLRKVSEDVVKVITAKCNSTLESIKNANKITGKTQKNTLERGNKTIRKTEQEIDILKAQLNNRIKICKEIIENTTNVQFDESNTASSINMAIKYFDNEIEALKKEMISTKENELIPVYNKNAFSEGDPYKEIAKNTISIIQQIKKDYSSISNFLEIVEVTNNVTSNYCKVQSMDAYRKIEKIYLYIVPSKSNNFKLTVVAKLKITRMAKGKRITPSDDLDRSGFFNDSDIEMVFVQGGTFTMGSPASEFDRSSDETQHSVTLSDFYIGKYEVTQKQWKTIMNSNPSTSNTNCDNCPVESVSWNDIQDFLRKLNEKTGKTYSLPTEAQWEYACRAGTSTTFNTGNNLTTDQANYNGNYPYNGNAKGTYRKKTMPVGSFAPNGYGLYDMHGNVWEWCSGWYGPYSPVAQTDPKGTEEGLDRVRRGGGWLGSARFCRAAYRSSYISDHRYPYIGFRLVTPK